MSTLGISSQENIYKKPSHRKNNSDELDVFEASRYFSNSNEVFIYNDSNSAQKNVREEKQGLRGGRISLDMPLMRTSIPTQSHKKENTNTKEKKNKPPSSPGGKLASFLNSLFNQTPSKKKKSKFLPHSMTDKEENLGGRKRRSSMSHFGSTFSKDSKPAYSNSRVSGFKSPSPYVNSDTPIKAYKEWNSSLSDISGLVIKTSSLQNDVTFIDDLKFITNGILEKPMKNNGIFEKHKRAKEIKRFDEVDDAGESDSSSDLFELENYDFKNSSSGLPVYETTHLDTIKRGPPISNGAI